jgi:hypothetical protein
MITTYKLYVIVCAPDYIFELGARARFQTSGLMRVLITGAPEISPLTRHDSKYARGAYLRPETPGGRGLPIDVLRQTNQTRSHPPKPFLITHSYYRKRYVGIVRARRLR